MDGAQTAGAYPIDVQAGGIDLLGFTGHKSMGGPLGTGGLIVGPRVDVTEMEPIEADNPLRPSTGIRLTLYWHSLDVIDVPYTVFV